MRFLWLVAALGLMLASAYIVGIFGFTPFAEVQRLGQVAYFEYAPDGPSYLELALTPARYAALRLGSTALLAGSAWACAGLLRKPLYRREVRHLQHEIGSAIGALRRVVGELSLAEKALGAALLVLMLGLQLFWLLNDSLSPDEIGSYDAFVHEGAAAVASFYPIPNNHVGYNMLSWALAQVLPAQVRLIMRLPSLLVATAGSALSGVLLTRRCNFRVAALVTALFGLTKLTIVYATAGRGYYLQFVCIQLAFFAAVEMLLQGHCRRLAWLVFIGSSVVGLYAIPTFALPLAGLLLALLAGSWRPNYRRGFLAQVLLAAAIIGAITLLLYAPVGCVSGWTRLLGNRYVAAQSAAAFWGTAKAYTYETTAMLLGSVRPALLLAGALLASAPLVLRRVPLPAAVRGLGWGSWLLVVVPLAYMLARQVFVPARALMYTTFFVYLLAALGADVVAARWGRKPAAWLPMLLLALLPCYGLVRFGLDLPVVFQSRATEATALRAYQWFRNQPPGPVFIQASYYAIMFHHYGLLDGRALTLDARRVAGKRYPYVIRAIDVPPSLPATGTPPYRASYRDAMVVIYTVR